MSITWLHLLVLTFRVAEYEKVIQYSQVNGWLGLIGRNCPTYEGMRKWKLNWRWWWWQWHSLSIVVRTWMQIYGGSLQRIPPDSKTRWPQKSFGCAKKGIQRKIFAPTAPGKLIFWVICATCCCLILSLPAWAQRNLLGICVYGYGTSAKELSV